MQGLVELGEPLIARIALSAHFSWDFSTSKKGVWTCLSSSSISTCIVAFSNIAFQASTTPSAGGPWSALLSAGGCHSHRLYSHSCDHTQSTVNGQTIRISAVNGQSGVSQRSNPSAEWTRLVLQFALNLAVGLHMHGTLIS